MAKESAAAAISSRPLKILAIVSSVNAFTAISNFLLRRGCTAIVVTDVKSAFQAMATEKPDFVLVSWNLRSASPSKIIESIEKQNTKTTCIGIAEENDNKTAASLASSNLKHIIHAPVSGPVLLMRIQKILKEREFDEPEEEFGLATGPSTNGTTKTEQQPSAKNVETSIATAIVPSKIQQALKLDLVKNVIVTALSGSGKSKPKSQGLAGGVIEVRGQNFFGYLFVMESTKKNLQKESLQNIRAEIERSFIETQSGFWTEHSYWLGTQVAAQTQDWMHANALSGVSGTFAGVEVDTYLIERKESRKLGDTYRIQGKKSLNLDLFVPDQKVSFDVYIHLNRNNKFLRYVKENTVFHQERLTKLKAKKVSQLFVNETDWNKVCEYDTQKFLQDNSPALLDL